jgi:hypothetical protein
MHISACRQQLAQKKYNTIRQYSHKQHKNIYTHTNNIKTKTTAKIKLVNLKSVERSNLLTKNINTVVICVSSSAYEYSAYSERCISEGKAMREFGLTDGIPWDC